MINEETNGWVLTAVWEVNFLFLLVGLSCLWAPSQGAKNYAYVMELTDLGDDGELEFDTNIDSPDSDDDDNNEGDDGEGISAYKDDGRIT